MTTDHYRQTFLDFFRDRGHEIVPSASLMPTAPNLLFTNAGMNQFVPFFLGERDAPWPRATDTQKCIRAGGKHNDLEDVGFDTYHHTFFEMMGNWSFGDYFKEEALGWSWELLTRVWRIPMERLYVTVYRPGPGEPAEPDEEAYTIWRKILEADGLDPERHILHGGKADNFWMMGETGPCGPCSEIHLDCTEKGDTGGALVNRDSAWCMEIWNNVFIQFNATPTGAFEPLRQRHVDTGLGLERVAGIAATTNDFTRFGELPSNYNADLFTAFFKVLEERTGHPYGASLPEGRENLEPGVLKDCGYRIVADHLRCLGCAIADGILPGNEGRNYVIRRILRRAVLWADRIGLEKGSLESLLPTVVASLGTVFPELKEQESVIRKVVASEENAFDKTLDRGVQLLEKLFAQHAREIPGTAAFELYDTYGFPLDLTQLMAREKGRTVDEAGFQMEMEKQRQRARAAQKKEVIEVKSEAGNAPATNFEGFDPKNLHGFQTTLQGIETLEKNNRFVHFLIFNSTPFYAEMGGQLGDSGVVEMADRQWTIVDTQKGPGGIILHQLEDDNPPELQIGTPARLSVDRERRLAIQRHHTATHLLNWALRKTLGSHIRQAGSLVAPGHLRFDFSHFEAIAPSILRDLENQVNRAVLQNDPVRDYEIPMEEKPDDVIAVFGEKYGNRVRVVDIGADLKLDADGLLSERKQPGYSAELCGGTHVRATGEVGPFVILSESSIAAGTRRIEAVAGEAALRLYHSLQAEREQLADLLSCPVDQLAERLQGLVESRKELETRLRAMDQKATSNIAKDLADTAVEKDGFAWVVQTAEVANPNELRQLAVQVADELKDSVVILGGAFGEKCSVLALVSDAAVASGIKAGDLIRDLTSRLDGKGGGKPDFAMGGGKAVADLGPVLESFRKGLESEN